MSADETIAFEKLQRVELRQRRALEMMGDGWAVVDAFTGLIVDTNGFFATLLGQTGGSRIGENFLNLLLREQPNEASALWQEIQQTGRARRIGLVIAQSAVDPREIDLIAQSFDEVGRQVVQFHVRRSDPIRSAKGDTDALARARDEAMAASAAKDRFLASLSHELRTPLNPALLLASENAASEQIAPNARRDFEAIRKHIELEVHLIDDILDLTRISQGKLSVNLQSVGLHGIIREAVTIIRAEVHEKKLNLAVQLEAEDDAIAGDAVRLQQVFWNLLRNAVKFTPTGGTISIHSNSSNEHGIEVRIVDTGVGLTSQEITRIFGAFAQGRHSEVSEGNRFGGLGLGLAISRMLVDLHGGSIRAESEGPDLGSTFIVAFPTRPANPAEAEPKTIPAVSRAPFRVRSDGTGRRMRALVVEDHFGSRAALAQLLERRGYDVVVAECGAQARQHAALDRFDVLISDIGLPDTSGYELMKEFRERYDLRGIALTGYGMEADVAQAEAAGFFSQLTKPVSIAALEMALMAFHSRAESGRGIPTVL